MKVTRPQESNFNNHMTTASTSDEESSSRAAGCLVRFAPPSFHKVYLVDRATEYSEAERSATWYSDKEYHAFQRHCEKTVERMEQGKSFKDIKLSSDGLHHWTKDGMRKQKRNRSNALDAVLNEQFAQWESATEDPESIAELYSSCAQHCQLVASTKALKVEREIQAYLVKDVPFFSPKPSAFRKKSILSTKSQQQEQQQQLSSTATATTATASSTKTGTSTRNSIAASSRSTPKSDHSSVSKSSWKSYLSSASASSSASSTTGSPKTVRSFSEFKMDKKAVAGSESLPPPPPPPPPPATATTTTHATFKSILISKVKPSVPPSPPPPPPSTPSITPTPGGRKTSMSAPTTVGEQQQQQQQEHSTTRSSKSWFGRKQFGRLSLLSKGKDAAAVVTDRAPKRVKPNKKTKKFYEWQSPFQ